MAEREKSAGRMMPIVQLLIHSPLIALFFLFVCWKWFDPPTIDGADARRLLLPIRKLITDRIDGLKCNIDEFLMMNIVQGSFSYFLRVQEVK